MAKGKTDREAFLSKEEVSRFLEKGFIHARAIIEMAGAPKEHLAEKLTKYINFIKKAENVKLAKIYIAKPKKNKKDDKLFVIYAELEILAKNASALAFFCFDYMPSSIEIISPAQLQYRGSDFASFFNDMLERIYRLDLVMKNLKAKSAMLEKNAGALLRNNVILCLKDREKDLAELSKNTGIPENQLTPFLDKIEKENWIKKKNNKYAINSNTVKVGKNV